jgi:hypothetical protein
MADKLASDVLRRSLDELPPQTRRLIQLIEELVDGVAARQGMKRGEVRFTQRDVREFTSWGNTQLKVHLTRLEEHEYVLVHRTHHAQRFVYELAYESTYDANRSGGGRGVVGLGSEEKPTGFKGTLEPRNADFDKPVGEFENALKARSMNGTSYTSIASYTEERVG